MASESDHHFSFQILCDALTACHIEDGTIHMDDYLNAYDEISKLLKLMGTVFNFVNSDVVEKVGILREYRKSDEKDHFESIQKMIDYEVQNKLTKNTKKESGCRTLLRLHRALEFICDFLLATKDAEEAAKLSGIASKSYYRTLSKHHPWIIRKGVDVAVYTLPSRKAFMEKMKINDIKQTEELMERAATMGNKVFAFVEKLYKDNNLLDLP